MKKPKKESVKVKALKKHGYGGKTRRQGTEYYMDNLKHVQILCAVKAIRICLEKSANEKLSNTKTKTKVTSPVDESSSDKLKNQNKKKDKDKDKGKYDRKDLTSKNYNRKASK